MAKTNAYETEQLKKKYDANLAATDPAQSLWDSLSVGYGQNIKKSNEAYDKSIAQMNTALQKRGMGRSSYGAQTVASMYGEKNRAANEIYGQMVADWQDRLTQMEEAEKARQFQTSEREATQAYNTSEREATQLYNTGEREAQQAYNTGEREATQRYNTGEREAQQAFSAGESALDRDQAQRQFEANYGLQKDQFLETQRQYDKTFGENQRQFNETQAENRRQYDASLAENQRQFAESQAEAARQYNETMAYNKEKDATSLEYQKSRDAVSDEQWEKTFNQNTTSDDRAYYASWVQSIAANGGDASDEILAKAGISREDFNLMKAQAAVATTGGGGGKSTPSKGNTDQGTSEVAVNDESFNAALGGSGDKVTINAAPAIDLVNRWAEQTSAPISKEITRKALVPKKTFGN